MSAKWIAIREQVTEAVCERIGLWEGDLVVDEVASSESKAEALKRLKTVIADCKAAMGVIKAVKV